MNKELQKLKAQYEAICEKYIEIFCEKQGCNFEFWISDIIGGTAYCSDYYLDFTDIVFDINSEQEKGLIFEWYKHTIEHEVSIHYFAYANGLRYPQEKATFVKS